LFYFSVYFIYLTLFFGKKIVICDCKITKLFQNYRYNKLTKSRIDASFLVKKIFHKKVGHFGKIKNPKKVRHFGKVGHFGMRHFGVMHCIG